MKRKERQRYRIAGEYIGCASGLVRCTQSCIEPGSLYRIRSENDLHCGNCRAICPAGAVEEVEE